MAELNPFLIKEDSPEKSTEFQHLVEPHQRELLVHCYRFLGSLEDAEDALQETLLRAWRRMDTLKEQASLRAWLYRIATNVCLDLIDSRKTRALVWPNSRPANPADALPGPVLEPVWLEPLPDEYLDFEHPGPEAQYDLRESVSLAFLALLQQLPGRQRAVLILRDVLGWKAQEVADLLSITPAAVNSALQRARAAFKQHPPVHTSTQSVGDPLTARLLTRYVQAWETSDSISLLDLLREDAVLSMPPLPAWYLGRQAVVDFLARHLFQVPGSFRLLAAQANGCPAFGVYQFSDSGDYRPSTLQVIALNQGQIARVDCFLVMDTLLFKRFGLPDTL